MSGCFWKAVCAHWETTIRVGFAYIQARDNVDTLQVRLPDINGCVCIVPDRLLQHTRDHSTWCAALRK